jgi:cell wall-associated NlpC family hydrolase
MTTKEQVVAYARETVGTPYKHQGRVSGLAFDCAGVPVYVGEKLGLKLADVSGYGNMPNAAQMRNKLDECMTRVPLAQMQPGDVVWIRFEGDPQHLAILGDYPHSGFSLIHGSNAGRARVIEHRCDEIWRRRIVAAWRFPEVE